jgi:hypothetical protein
VTPSIDDEDSVVSLQFNGIPNFTFLNSLVAPFEKFVEAKKKIIDKNESSNVRCENQLCLGVRLIVEGEDLWYFPCLSNE